MATATGYSLFDTAIGPCGLVWGGRGVLAVQLPEADAAATRACIACAWPEAAETEPPADVAAVRDGIVALLAGEPRGFSDAPLDMDGVPEFHRRVYGVALAIPPGATLTYGEVAARLGEPGAARAVGQALGKNPFPIVVPCHRVLASGGRTGGFSGHGGVATKFRLLAIEKARGEAGLFGDLPLAVAPRR